MQCSCDSGPHLTLSNVNGVMGWRIEYVSAARLAGPDGVRPVIIALRLHHSHVVFQEVKVQLEDGCWECCIWFRVCWHSRMGTYEFRRSVS